MPYRGLPVVLLWKKEFLQLLPGTLLFAGNAGEDSDSHADKRTEMLLHHPLLSISHAVEGMKNKKAGKKPDA